MLRDNQAVSIDADQEQEDAASVTPRSVAEECLAQSDGDWFSAAKLMRTRIDSDMSLFEEIVRPLLDQAIWQQIRLAAHAKRVQYTAQRVDDTSGIAALAKREADKWMDYPLSGGVKLGDADEGKLQSEAEMHAAMARGNQVKADFFSEIAKKLNGKVVRKVLSDSQLQNIWESFK